jgi:DnaJ-class molecular chaperone
MLQYFMKKTYTLPQLHETSEAVFDIYTVICQGCNGKGHFQNDCPSAQGDSRGEMDGKI